MNRAQAVDRIQKALLEESQIVQKKRRVRFRYSRRDNQKGHQRGKLERSLRPQGGRGHAHSPRSGQRDGTGAEQALSLRLHGRRRRRALSRAAERLLCARAEARMRGGRRRRRIRCEQNKRYDKRALIFLYFFSVFSKSAQPQIRIERFFR